MRQSLAILPRSASADTTAHRKPLGSGVSQDATFRVPCTRLTRRASSGQTLAGYDHAPRGAKTDADPMSDDESAERGPSTRDRRQRPGLHDKNGTAQLDVTVVPMVVGRLCSSISRTQRHDVNMCGMTTRCAASVPRGKQNVGSLRPRPQGRSTTRARKRTPVQHRICPHGAAAGQVLYTLYFMSPWRSRGRSGTRGSVSVALCRAVG